MRKAISIALLATLTHSTSFDALVAKVDDLEAHIALAKPFGLDKEIRAIIKIESDNGLYPINLQDPACGITHIHLKTFFRRHGLKDTPFNRNKWCSLLIKNPDLAVANAIEELLFWQKQFCKGKCNSTQHKNMIKAYNAGWNYKGAKAQEYYNKFEKEYQK